MDTADLELIEELAPRNEELRLLVQAHRAFEEQLDELGRRRYLSVTEQQEVARIKKEKLRGKDRILQILAEHRRGRA